MQTPPAAITWEFGRRYRLGWLAIAATVATLGIIRIAFLTKTAWQEMDSSIFALLIPVPLAATFFFILAVFTYGLAGDLASRQSIFPARLFTLPVSNAVLAGWPMILGGLAMTLTWILFRAVGVFPPGFEVPLIWPALFAWSILAWAQALTWMPYPLRGMRVVITVVLLISIDAVVMTALELKARESTMLLLLAPLVPLAFPTAVAAVRRARRGDVPSWPWASVLARSAGTYSTQRQHGSPASAQFWFEWKQYGRTLPFGVAMVLPVGAALLFPFREVAVVVVEIVVLSLLLPPFLALFVAAAAAKSGASGGLSSFLATRPIEDRALVLAKWKASLLSTLVTWAIVLIILAVGLLWAGAAEPLLEIARRADGALGRTRAVILGCLILAVLIGSTWKGLVQGFYISMSGREGAVKAMAFATLVAVTLGFFFLGWILDSHVRSARAWVSIPWVLTVLVLVKLALAIWVIRRGGRAGLFTARQLRAAAASWNVAVFALFALLALILPSVLVRRDLLLLLAILVVPFVRLMAAPIAVAGNRHR